jgi:hypothetical protein
VVTDDMFESLKNKFFFSTVPRIVHSLPGRVRIHFPALERVSARWHKYTAPVSELVNLKQGIQNTYIQPTTGNVLITYDAEMLGENEILKWLEIMVKIILYNIRDYSSISEENLESLLNRIRTQLTALEK